MSLYRLAIQGSTDTPPVLPPVSIPEEEQEEEEKPHLEPDPGAHISAKAGKLDIPFIKGKTAADLTEEDKEKLTKVPYVWPAGWIHPVPTLVNAFGGESGNKLGLVSSGFGTKRSGTRKGRGHYGVDIMYERDKRGKRRYPIWDKRHFMPNGIPALAAGPGKVWFAGNTSTGWAVVIDHGYVSGVGPVTTAYRHLGTIYGNLKKGDPIEAGQQLGPMSYSPIKKRVDLNHLHFSVKVFPVKGMKQIDANIDPKTLLKQTTRKEWRFKEAKPVGAPLLAALGIIAAMLGVMIIKSS